MFANHDYATSPYEKTVATTSPISVRPLKRHDVPQEVTSLSDYRAAIRVTAQPKTNTYANQLSSSRDISRFRNRSRPYTKKQRRELSSPYANASVGRPPVAKFEDDLDYSWYEEVSHDV